MRLREIFKADPARLILCIHRSFASDTTLSHEGSPSSDYLVSAARMATPSEPVPKLFQPIKVGDMALGHHVVMAPLTRGRATKKHVHTDIAVTYYAQRASVRGTLIIAEATFIAPRAGLYDHVPGVWNDEQIAAWKKVSGDRHTSFSYRRLTLVDRSRTLYMRRGLTYTSNFGRTAVLRTSRY